MYYCSWNSTIIAKAEHCFRIEKEYYFHKNYVDMAYLTLKQHQKECPFKGVMYYYDISVDGETNP